jgi:hypothetical protein
MSSVHARSVHLCCMSGCADVVKACNQATHKRRYSSTIIMRVTLAFVDCVRSGCLYPLCSYALAAAVGVYITAVIALEPLLLL